MNLYNLIIEQELKSVDLFCESMVAGMLPEQQQIVEGIVQELCPLIAASITVREIDALFKGALVEQGSARSMLGKGIDVVKKANEIVNKTGRWLQDTQPVQNFDAKFEQLKGKITEKFPKLAKNISAVGEWAKANPKKTAAVVGVLTAIASLATGPIGGAIAGQILRGTSELLKGEKLSTAVGKSAKSAALGGLVGLGAEAIGDMFNQGAEYIKDTLFPEARKLRLSQAATGLGYNWIEVIGRPKDLEPIKSAWEAAGKAWDHGDLYLANKMLVRAKNLAAELARPEYALEIVKDREASAAITKTADMFITAIDSLGVAMQGAATASNIGNTSSSANSANINKSARSPANSDFDKLKQTIDKMSIKEKQRIVDYLKTQRI